MHTVYHDNAVVGVTCTLIESEAQHLMVLRAKVGDSIEVFDGLGGLYDGQIVEMGKKGTTVSIMRLLHTTLPPSPRLHIAIAPTKNNERFDWFIEKAVEMGISRITPIICRQSERREIRIDRLQKIIISAAKQSQNYHLPILDEPTSFDKFIKAQSDDKVLRTIAHCAMDTRPIQEVVKSGIDTLILIGPEGDFHTTEIDMALSTGFVPISLGSSRLRTETAGIYVAGVFRYMNRV